ACRILDPASLNAACSSALGSVVAKSALERWPSWLNGIIVPVVLLPLLVFVLVLVLVFVLVLVLLCTWMLERGLKFSGRFNPVEAMAAVICLLKVLLA